VDERANRGKPLVTVTIYVEGGGKKNKDGEVRCRTGFRSYCDKLAPRGAISKIVVCGGRNDAFHRFGIEIRKATPGEIIVLLVDSEGPVPTAVLATAFLRDGPDRCEFPETPNYRVFLMVQAMEAWLLADRQALADYYGQGFRLNALRGDERNVEAIPKHDLAPSLANATRDTTKRKYDKMLHGFDPLARIDPRKVGEGSRRAAEFNDFCSHPS
jgi:hypothetical protein